MQQIINVLIKNKNFVVFVFLLIFSFFFIKSQSFYHETKLNSFKTSLSGKLFQLNSLFKEYISLVEKNEALFEENKKLKEIILNKKTFKYSSNTENNKYEIINAKIIKNDIKSSRNFIILNKGKKDGVKKEMGVISPKGIVGIVNSVSEHYSNVISVLNRDLSINAKHKKSNAFGSLNWNGVNPERLQLLDIASINILNVGDTIITGGMSTYFPEDILIGRIIDYAITKENGYYDIEIELSNNIGNLNKVYIIDNKHKDEIKGFE
tara:strand:- start:301 stop:1095 length:795 start_codon:yes stop_codon:yes gene_type:complete